MRKINLKKIAGMALVLTAAILSTAVMLPDLAFAQDTAKAVTEDAKYVLNTFLFLVAGFLVMWMAAGFAMLEAGMVRSKNVAMQCTKNIALFSIAGLVYWA
ncbi:MAG: ammonium transporter, partial [Methyloligellaceae bacterium]